MIPKSIIALSISAALTGVTLAGDPHTSGVKGQPNQSCENPQTMTTPAPNSLRHLKWRHRLFFSSIRTIGWLRNARPWGFDSLQSGTAMVKCLGFSCFSPDQEYAARKPSLATL